MMEQEVTVTSHDRDIRFDVPLYTLAEAARALGVPAPTFATWARGYVRRRDGRRPVQGAPIVTTVGAELLFDHAREIGDSEELVVPQLVVVRSGQRVFAEVVQDYLKRLTYGDDGYAARIRLPAYDRADVVVDPDHAFGQPVFHRGGARVSDVLERFWAGDDIDTLAAEYGAPAEEIEDVLRAASRRAA